MKPYLSTFRLRFLHETQYRGAAWGGIATQVFFGLLLIFLYRAFYESGGQISTPFALISTYVWLQQAFLRLGMGSEPSLNSMILSGNIVYELCRPVDLYGYWMTRIAAYKAMAALMRAVPMFIFAILLPAPYGISAPSSWNVMPVFFVSLLLGLGNSTVLAGIMHGIVLRTLDNRGAANVISLAGLFFSGNLIPLTLMPDSWQSIMQMNPFAQMLDVPIRIYTGQAMAFPLFGMILMQVVWFLALAAFGWFLWNRNLRRMVLQGG